MSSALSEQTLMRDLMMMLWLLLLTVSMVWVLLLRSMEI